MTARRARLALAVVAGCAAAPAVPSPRFANAPAVGVVDDRRDVATAPRGRRFLADVYHYDGVIQRRLDRGLELRRARRALGVNALDEVPDSTWFTHRIDARPMSPDEIRAGPLTADSPELHLPWTVRSSKVGGTSPGLIIKDGRGVKYLLKFDGQGNPEIETATHVIVNRLLWAAGYNVAEDQIVSFHLGDLVVAPDARRKRLDGGDDGPLDRAALDAVLAAVERAPGGRIRALASRWLEGTTLGGHPAEGVRDDDPNDRIPHELRRDLRGAYTVFAWLDHVDVQESNFLDAWVADPADPRRHYVKHYLLDFGKSLGAMATLMVDLRRGHTYVFDLADSAWTLVTLGWTDRAWQHRTAPPFRGVGLLDVELFAPGAWHPDSPAYVPFVLADRFDKFWGAKLVARFTAAQLRAAVDAGKLSDPRAVDFVVAALIARQRATAAYWFTQVNPLDQFTVAHTPGGPALCFEDLAIASGVAPAAATRYAIAGFDFDAERLGAPVELVADGARTCTPALALAPRWNRDGYTIIRVATARPGFTGETFVHLARAPGSGQPRVIGLWRP
jgi:hypothetical protein